MLDRNVRHADLDRIHPLGNSCDPLIGSNCCHTERYSFVQGRGSHVNRVVDAVHVLDRHLAGSD